MLKSFIKALNNNLDIEQPESMEVFMMNECNFTMQTVVPFCWQCKSYYLNPTGVGDTPSQ